MLSSFRKTMSDSRKYNLDRNYQPLDLTAGKKNKSKKMSFKTNLNINQGGVSSNQIWVIMAFVALVVWFFWDKLSGLFSAAGDVLDSAGNVISSAGQAAGVLPSASANKSVQTTENLGNAAISNLTSSALPQSDSYYQTIADTQQTLMSPLFGVSFADITAPLSGLSPAELAKVFTLFGVRKYTILDLSGNGANGNLFAWYKINVRNQMFGFGSDQSDLKTFWAVTGLPWYN